MKQMMIAGTHSGVGKTTVTLGIMQALLKRGMKVQPCKVGPDYKDTAFHSRLCGRKSINLDEYLIGDLKTNKGLYYQGMEGADIAVTEGVMGLYDGMGSDKNSCSSAGMALALDLPVVLILDGSALSTSAAAVVKGFADLEPDLNVVGAIINFVAGESHYELIRQAVEAYTDIKVLGYLTKDGQFSKNFSEETEEDFLKKIDLLAQSMEKTINLDSLLELIDEPLLTPSYIEDKSWAFLGDFHGKVDSPVSLAYAEDQAFNFYYASNLDLLAKKGVELIPFSPIADEEVPRADGYYFGGGRIAMYAEELASNERMKESLHQAFTDKKPIFAEGEALIYLGESFEKGEKSWQMAGLLQGKSCSTDHVNRFGYSSFISNHDMFFSKAGEEIRGHECHLFDFQSEEVTAGELENKPLSTRAAGYVKDNLFASYLHLHFYQDPRLAERWIASLEESRKKSSYES